MEIERELATPSAILYTWSAVMTCMCVACITMQHVFKEFNKLWKMIFLSLSRSILIRFWSKEYGNTRSGAVNSEKMTGSLSSLEF